LNTDILKQFLEELHKEQLTAQNHPDLMKKLIWHKVILLNHPVFAHLKMF